MVATSSHIRVLDDIPTCMELYDRVQSLRTSRHVIVKVDRTTTAAEAMPAFQNAVDLFREGDAIAGSDDVIAITMMSVGIVVRGQDGKRATNRNVDIIWFPDVPGTTFFANQDIAAYAGDWPDVLLRSP